MGFLTILGYVGISSATQSTRIHHGSLDEDTTGTRTDRLEEWTSYRVVLFAMQILEHLHAKPQLLRSSIVLDPFILSMLLGNISIRQILWRGWVDLSLRSTDDFGIRATDDWY
jgi:hypothetical protein